MLQILSDERQTGGVLAEKFGRGVRPASQNPYPIYDQNLRFSLPYLWPNQKFDTLFMTWPLNQYPVSDLAPVVQRADNFIQRIGLPSG